MSTTTEARQLDPVEQRYAITTWRYLRLAMVALVLGLGASIGYEAWKVDPSCLQESISAYYYTPAQGFFVGALLAIGTCLFCLKGSTHTEDTLLNLAGMFAPIVALVPTPGTGHCASVLGTTRDRDVNVANNVFALLVVGAFALVTLAVLARRKLPPWPARAGYLGAAAVWLIAALLFVVARDLYVDTAHYTAAIAMFGCILAVVVLNALGFKDKTRAATPGNRYAAVAGAMVLAAAGIGAAGAFGWDYWIIAIETALILLFAVFWTIQTIELWHAGLR